MNAHGAGGSVAFSTGPWAWLVLLISLTVYLEGFPRTVAYGVVAASMLLFSGLSLLLEPAWRRLRSPGLDRHFWILVGVVFLSQVGSVVAGGLTEIGAIQGLAYVVGLVSAYYVLAAAFELGWRTNLRALAWLGAGLSLIAVYVSTKGSLSLAGTTFRAASYRIPGIGLSPTSGLFVDENYFAVVLFICGTCALYLRTTSQHAWGPTVYTGVLLLHAVGLLLTYSRAAFLAVAVVAFVWFSFGRSGRLALWSAVVAVAVTWVALLPALDHRVVDFLQIDRGLTGREELWKIALEHIQERPWTGWGVGNVHLVLQEETRWASSHNTILDFMLMAGVPGGLAYVYFALASLKPVFRPRPGCEQEARFLLCVLSGMILLAQFTTHTVGGLSFGSLTLTTLLGVANNFRRNRFGPPP